MPLKLLHVIFSSDPQGGGPIENTVRMSLELIRMGHESEIVTLDDPNSPWLTDYPVKIHALGKGIGKYGYSARLISWLRKNREEYDAVFIRGLWRFNSYAVWKVFKSGVTPYFIFPHGMLDPWFKRALPFKHLLKRICWSLVEFRILRDASAVLFTSETERGLARTTFKNYSCTEVVIPYGTKGFMGDKSQLREAFFERFPSLRDKRIILYLGRIDPKKGVDLILNAFAEICNSNVLDNTQWHVVIAGGGNTSYTSELLKLSKTLELQDTVTFIGEVQNDIKWGAFCASEVFILPSHQENFGIAVVEALSCSVPVLITKQVNIWREIVEKKGGIAGEDDVSGIKTLIETWLSLSEIDREVYQKNALQCFNLHFRIETSAEAIVALVDSHTQKFRDR